MAKYCNNYFFVKEKINTIYKTVTIYEKLCRQGHVMVSKLKNSVIEMLLLDSQFLESEKV